MCGETFRQHASIFLPTVTSVAATDEALALQLQLPHVDPSHQEYDFLLVYDAEHLVLQPTAPNAPGAISVDFVSGRAEYRRTQGGKKELVARACGIKGENKPSIIDATAGLGRDAFVLAYLGCHVTMIERSPIIAALLADGLKRLHADKTLTEQIDLHLVNADAVTYLQQKPAIDVIYLDPMYPHKKSSALVKKEMRLLRAIVGDDDNADSLLEAAITCAKKRVVVKRPRLAPTVNDRKPDIVYTGKNSRFDVYLMR